LALITPSGQTQAKKNPAPHKNYDQITRVKEWDLFFQWEIADQFSQTYDYQVVVNADIQLSGSLKTVLRPDPGFANTWTNKEDKGPAASLAYKGQKTLKGPGLRDMVTTYKGQLGDLGEHHPSAQLSVNLAKGTYTLGGGLTYLHTKIMNDPYFKPEEAWTSLGMGSRDDKQKVTYLSEGVTTLAGSDEFPIIIAPFNGLDPMSFNYVKPDKPLGYLVPWTTVHVQWTLSPGRQGPEPDVIVEIAGYDDWKPEAGANEDEPGNILSVDAYLQGKDGKLSREKAKKFTFELLETSRIIGVCCNHPDAGDPALDMKFVPDSNKQLKVTERDQKAETKEGEFAKAQANITSCDYGGTSRLKVTAEMKDGTKIVGYLKGDKSKTEIPLPKRTGDSKIADAWKKSMGVTGLADNDDSATDPEGNGTPGDGLSLYEKYRGFMENGKHIRLKPKIKHIFIVNQIGERAEDGIKLVRSNTGLEIHDKLKVNREKHEADAEGWVNFNSIGNTTPYLGKKWAVIMQVKSTNPKNPASSQSHGKPGAAKDVFIGAGMNPGLEGYSIKKVGKGRVTTDAYASTVAHEILHCLGVQHHGDSDLRNVWWAKSEDEMGLLVIKEYPKDPGGDAKIAGREIHVFLENSKQELSPNSRALVLPSPMYVAEQNGEHSGLEDCVMRYSCADAYVYPKGSNTRYLLTEPEMPGISLCEGRNPIVVLAPGRLSRPRYGSATAGDCKHQFCANDAHPSGK